MKMKIKNGLHRYDKNRPKSKHEHKYSKYKKCFNMMMLLYILINTEATFEAQFMKKWSNTEPELKKGVAYKKSV